MGFVHLLLTRGEALVHDRTGLPRPPCEGRACEAAKVKDRFVRPGDHLDDAVSVVVRGGTQDRGILWSDAQRMHAVYGIYGVSVFTVREVPLDELAQQPPLVRFS
jgi:hypothetical protein